MFCYQDKVNAGVPQICTPEIWDKLIDSPEVKNLCDRIAELDPNDENYNDRKQALKRRLPIIIPHAASFANGKRISADATPSGLAMLDVDHVSNPREAYLRLLPEGKSEEWFIENGIYLIAITASGHGLRVIGRRNSLPFREGAGLGSLESIEAAQLRIATALGITEYDAVTKDLARASYVVPRDYILWIYEAGLFSEEERSDLKELLALPPHVNSSSISPEFDSETLSLEGRAGEGFLTYRGIPYADIVQQLLIAIGAADGAVQGERNTVYFSMANYMRYICDFNVDLLLQVLPDFGLSETERRQVITSAIGRPRKSQIPMILQGVIAVCERESLLSARNVRSEKATDLPLPELPRLLKLVCRRLPADYRPAMIVASLPVLGTLATGIRFEYLDRQEQSLSFFSCITAPAASGKSFIRKPLDLLLTPINENDELEREKEQAYKEKLRASKNSKNQPEDPHACPRNNGIAISIAKLLQLLTYAEGKHLIGIGEEMDTLVKTERAGVWSQKSDIYRLAFDNGIYGQAYMSDASFNAHIKVYYNLLLTGTPNSLKRFFKDPEDGLITRVCFAQLPDTSFTEIPAFASYTEAEKAEIIRWARQLDAEKGTISCPQVGTVIADWLERKRQQAIDADSHAMDTLRRRAAVIGFRAGMLCYLLENHKYTKTVGAFAEWVAEYIFRNQMELWGTAIEQTYKSSIESQTERGAAASLLSLLPEEFTAADLIKLRARKGQSVKSSAISMVLNRWKANHRIEKFTETTWRKIQ
ncbi:MAG: BT4734/BF3469 family protein [Paludibacteraceae bacterium]|nr:BT4734/BF3469 family protein [Paludibacteraceae bacterium]